MDYKKILKPVVFIGIFLVILTALTYVLRTNGDVKERFTGFYAEKKDTVDVVMIGSSPVYPYYSAPQIWGEYGITSYPLSTNLQRPVAATYLVKEALKTQKPSLFIFEMRMYTAADSDLVNNMAYTRGVTDNLKYSWNRIETINDMVSDVSERYTYYFDIFKYHSNWKTIILPSQLVRFTYEYPDDLKGWVIYDEVGPSEIADYSEVTTTKAMPEDAKKNLIRLLNFLKEEDLPALFIVSPYTMTEEKQQMYNDMEPIITSYGFEFLNLNDHYQEIGIDFATDFYDYGGHVNASGSLKCTEFLGDYLKNNYSFEDRRDQEGYASWDESYQLWKTEQAKAEETIKKRIENKDFAVISEE